MSYYWAIDRSADATFSADVYTKRYYGLGTEARARPSEGTRFEGTYYIIKDPTVDRWRWRVMQLPSGGDEGRKATHDSAAGVYVIFDNRILPRVLKYVWSATLPVGTSVG